MAELRVLVAEDHPLNQVYAIMLLEKMGHRAEGVGTGREVLESLAEKGWDLILMDVEMPDMDGLEACRRIRAGTVHGCPPDIPIVALTGHTMAEDVFRFHEAGMSAHLPKPLCGDGLQQVIRSLINGA